MSELISKYTLDEIHPTQIKVPDYIIGSERDKLITEGRIRQAQQDAKLFDLDTLEVDPKKRFGSGEFAFLVHSRDLSDIPLQFPYLSKEYLSETEIRARFREIPPFRASRITGLLDKDGQELRGWLVIATILPDQILDRHELPWVKANILKTAKLAYMLGADIVGLGAMSATLTHLGRSIEDDLKIDGSSAINVTTGHSYTSFLIRETLIEISKKTQQNLKKSTVAIVGAAGSIGKTAAHLVLPEIGRLILVDTKGKSGKLKNFIEDEGGKYDTQMEYVTIEGNNDPNYFYLKEADFVVFATTQVNSFVKKEWLKPGVVVIDDSAPINIADGVSDAVGGMTVHVVANMPGEFSWNFDFKLAPGSSFGCGAEVAALAAQHQFDQGVIGEVTNGGVDRIARIAQASGFVMGSLQSFGRLKSDEEFARVGGLKRHPNI